MSKYKYLIFDLDDTLFDFQKTERKSLEVIFNKYNLPFEDDYINNYKTINMNLWDKLEQNLVTKEIVLNTRFKEFFSLYNLDVDGYEIESHYRTNLNNGHDILEGSIELLQELRNEGYKIFAGTNGVSITQRKRLLDSNLLDYFDDLFISEELGYEKPNVEFFEHIFSRYDYLSKENTLMIGDRLNSDIQGANNFGIDSVWFNPNKKESTHIKPTYEIESLHDLLNILN